MTLSQLEHCLSYHVRMLLPHVLSKKSSHRMAYTFSLLCAMSSGFITIISLYAKPWQARLQYSAWQINMIATVTNLGMYLTPPILGIIADAHGPITLSALAILGFLPSYTYVSYIFNHPELSNDYSFKISLLCFAVIGISTSSLYFSALLTCAKLYPKKKVLSISLPTTSFGISSLIGSQVLRIPYFWAFDENGSYLDLGRVFITFTYIYAAVGLLAWIATSTVSMLHHYQHPSEYSIVDSEQEPLLPIPPEERFEQKNFFKDPIAYILALSILLALGPLEMFIANMGSLTNLISDDSSNLASQLVSLYAVSSTVTRLFTGILTDFFTAKKISPKWILLALLCTALLSQILILGLASSSNTPSTWRILSMGPILGFVYGGLFTIYPTIVLIVWGDKLFGTAYGSMMIAPALGSGISCLAYAKVYDAKCVSKGAIKSSCIAPVYKLTSAQLACSIIITLIVFKTWKRRNLSL